MGAFVLRDIARLTHPRLDAVSMALAGIIGFALALWVRRVAAAPVAVAGQGSASALAAPCGDFPALM